MMIMALSLLIKRTIYAALNSLQPILQVGLFLYRENLIYTSFILLFCMFFLYEVKSTHFITCIQLHYLLILSLQYYLLGGMLKTQLILDLHKSGSKILSDDGIFINNMFEFSSVSCMGHWVYYNLIAFPELLDLLTDDQRAYYALAQTLVSNPSCSSRLSDHIKSITRFRTQVVPSDQFNYFYSTNNVIFLAPDATDNEISSLTNYNLLSLVHSKIYSSTVLSFNIFMTFTRIFLLSGRVDPIIESSKYRLSKFLDSFLQSVIYFSIKHPDSALL